MSLQQLKPAQRWEELKWRANWYNLAGNMLELSFKKQNSKFGLEIVNKENWENYKSLDFFPGFYYMNCMLQLIARKQEIQLLKKQTGGLYEPLSIQHIRGGQPFYIGKEISLIDITDPLAKITLSDQKFREIVSSIKLQIEDSQNLDEKIIEFGNRAIGCFKLRSFQLKGPAAVLHKRTVHMINYQISEVLADSHHHPTEFESTAFTFSDRQHLRKEVAQSLLQE